MQLAKCFAQHILSLEDDQDNSRYGSSIELGSKGFDPKKYCVRERLRFHQIVKKYEMPRFLKF